MTRIYDALRRMEQEDSLQPAVAVNPPQPLDFLHSFTPEQVDLRVAQSVRPDISVASRLVALTERQGLGAEKFRALATRLEHLRKQKELKSLLVTSSVPNEGKTLVTTNLALTLAQNQGSKVLLVEGDLHRPGLGLLLGLAELKGTRQWWSNPDETLASFIHKLEGMPLWFLAAGSTSEHPSNILQSKRFVETFPRVAGAFDWVIVDSPPLLPFADANLWSRLVDGMLLVVREGIASVRGLRKGLEAIDNLNLLGIVLNDASDFERHNYERKYYFLQR